MIQRCVGQSNKIVPGLSLERKTLKPLKQTGTVRLGAGSSAWYAASCKGCWLKNVRFARAFAQWPRYTGRPRVQIPPCPPKQSRAVVCDRAGFEPAAFRYIWATGQRPLDRKSTRLN